MVLEAFLKHPRWIANQPQASHLTLVSFPSISGSFTIFCMAFVEQFFIFMFFRSSLVKNEKIKSSKMSDICSCKTKNVSKQGYDEGRSGKNKNKNVFDKSHKEHRDGVRNRRKTSQRQMRSLGLVCNPYRMLQKCLQNHGF